MRRSKPYSLVALLGLALPSVTMAQSLSDLRPAKPLMMLLVDTSGSMERRPKGKNDPPGLDDPLPRCTGISANDATEKSRWHITIEALNGSYTAFTCQRQERRFPPAAPFPPLPPMLPLDKYKDAYDQNYFLPHFAITSSSRVPDGVLEAFQGRLKFGLMTFDGVNTAQNEATLSPFAYAGNTAATSIRNKADLAPGMWSYPPKVDKTFGWKELSYPACVVPYGINAGARSKEATEGALIPPQTVQRSGGVWTVREDEPALIETAKKVQTALEKVRPYGGTPTAAMLDDLRYFLRNDPDIVNDPYHGCRERYAILLTDGAPDPLFRNDPKYGCEKTTTSVHGVCEGVDCCPYDPEEEIAKNLLSDGLKKLWVVAFNVEDRQSIGKLHEIAKAGGSEEAIKVESAGDLRPQLSRLLNEVNPSATSRSVPVVVGNGKPVALGGKQYEITAGFRVGQLEDPWDGFLFRRRVQCEGASSKAQVLEESMGDMFHLTLNKRSAASRNLWTVAPTTPLFGLALPGMLTNTLFGTATTKLDDSTRTGASRAPNPIFQLSFPYVNDVRPDGMSLSGSYSRPSIFSDDLRSKGYAFEDIPTDEFDKNLSWVYFGSTSKLEAVNNYLRGEPQGDVGKRRSEKKLGDIYHSNPVVLPPLTRGSDLLNTFDPQQRDFNTDLLSGASDQAKLDTSLRAVGRYGTAGRPGVVFVGTNDGILHAFNLDTWAGAGTNASSYEAGRELWGFIPPALFGKLPTVAEPTHLEMFDGTPVVQDVIYRPARGGKKAAIGTVLLSAVRGAPAYIAMDVTWPEQPEFLWQRTFWNLGKTVATPAIAHARIRWSGHSQPVVRAMAILPGGQGELQDGVEKACPVHNDNHGRSLTGGREQVRCWETLGRSLYVVDVATGELIQEFDARHFPSPLTGSVAVDSEGLSATRAAYFTDDDGVLWRLWMNDPDPSNWRVQPIWDLFAQEASLIGTITAGPNRVAAPPAELFKAGRTAPYAPVVARDPASGNYTIMVGTGDPDQLGSTYPHRVVSLEERRNYNKDGSLTVGSPPWNGAGVQANWQLQLDPRESVTGPMTMFEDTLYFTSFRPPSGSENQCAMGTSRIVGARVRDAKGAKRVSPTPMLVPEGASGPPYVLSYFPSQESSSLLLGLNISRDLVCVQGGSVVNDPLTGARMSGGTAGGGEYRMRMMVGGGSSPDTIMAGSVTSGSPGLHQLQRTLPIQNVARSVGWANSIE